MGIKGGAQIKNGQLFFKHKPQNNSKNITVLLRKSTKMRTLETAQRVLTWLCGIPPDKFASKRKRITYMIFTTGRYYIGSFSIGDG